tara:strand:+ start:9558 stop:9725 length:168 start_codon:yes stop_codon:yes gene_type:complete
MYTDNYITNKVSGYFLFSEFLLRITEIRRDTKPTPADEYMYNWEGVKMIKYKLII